MTWYDYLIFLRTNLILYPKCEKCEKMGTIHKHHAFARIFSPTEKVSFPPTQPTPTGAPPAPEFKVLGTEEHVPKIHFHSRFVRDVNIPDGTKVEAGNKFIKTWCMRNNGNQAWPQGTVFVNIGGDFMGRVESVPVECARPGDEVEISVEVEVPRKPGRYVSNVRSTLLDMNTVILVKYF